MKNTTENRLKFYAQHLGQNMIIDSDCFRSENGNDIIQTTLLSVSLKGIECDGWIPVTEHTALELKPLSSITDEDLFYLPLDYSYPDTKIISAGEIVFSEKSKSLLIELSIKYIRNGNKCGSIYYQELRQPQIDYLRMSGYAVPWMELTIEELINYGWIKVFRNKIIENKN